MHQGTIRHNLIWKMINILEDSLYKPFSIFFIVFLIEYLGKNTHKNNKIDIFAPGTTPKSVARPYFSMCLQRITKITYLLKSLFSYKFKIFRKYKGGLER